MNMANNRIWRLLAGCWLLVSLPLQAAEERPVMTVTTIKPVSITWPQTLQVNGGIFAWQEAVVASEIGGLALVSLSVDVGSVVKKGQELAKLSDATVKASLAQQRANLARAKAGLALAKANSERAKAVKGTGALSDQQTTQYLLAEESSTAEVAAAQAAVEMEEVRLRQTRILAADDGIISSRTATLGAVVQVGSELFRLVRQGRLEWRAELTAQQLGRIQNQQQATVTLSNGSTTTATLRQIAPTLDGISRKALAYFDLPSDVPAKAGMFGQGEIRLGEEAALILPQSAIVMNDGYAYVFQLTGDKVSRRKVTTGRRQDNKVEILSGVEQEHTLVAEGGAFLKEGDRVRLAEVTR
ncbi:MAG: efflux RND transporter periplasmic adaptor subunit [Magnetococcales bacterium]|nr:efflux RND transporter periplasmic adaptor subunit [Magnetococcales bacterium]NGZ28889.1 efflux RND transporter periplasmic adaptor subunit [Magnetococcales bacterium]